MFTEFKTGFRLDADLGFGLLLKQVKGFCCLKFMGLCRYEACVTCVGKQVTGFESLWRQFAMFG